MPGTTRDAIKVDFDVDGQPFRLIDTAGLRKKGKVFEAIEKFSVIKTLQAIEQSNVVILVLDAVDGISTHDAHIAGFALEAGRALVVAINKWDGVDSYKRKLVDNDLETKFHFLKWARFIHISALKRNGLNHLMQAVRDAHAASFAKLSTPKLTRAMMAAVEQQQPARSGRLRPKLRYAHQGGMNPPVIVIHGNSLQAVSDSYKRYLEGVFRDAFNLAGTPLRVEFRTNKNPYAEGEDKR
jgi:GTP-binding protein